MTENKRFEYVKPVVAFAKSGVIDNLKRNTFDFTEDTVIDILNELADENEQLKKELEDALLDVKIYKNANATFDNVYQENNKLKSRIEYLERKIRRERISAMKEHEKWEKEIRKENEQLKQKMGVLLYQIGEAGKNNKTCRECECFIPEHNICYMWDMEVEADEVVVACDRRKVKNTNGMMSDD